MALLQITLITSASCRTSLVRIYPALRDCARSAAQGDNSLQIIDIQLFPVSVNAFYRIRNRFTPVTAHICVQIGIDERIVYTHCNYI